MNSVIYPCAALNSSDDDVMLDWSTMQRMKAMTTERRKMIYECLVFGSLLLSPVRGKDSVLPC